MTWPLVWLLAAGCNRPSADRPGTLSADTAGTVATDAPRAANNEGVLREKLDRMIEMNRDRHMSPQTNSAWQIVHGVLAFGPDLLINDDGKLVPALDWLLSGHELKGWELKAGDGWQGSKAHGKGLNERLRCETLDTTWKLNTSDQGLGDKGLRDVVDPGSKTGEGHDDQWLGYLAQCDMPLDTPIKIRGVNEPFTIADLVTQAQWDVHEGMELTWTLMGLGHYLPLDARWTASDGKEWTLEKLVASEAGQELNISSCGGTHRMYGIAVAVNRYLEAGKQLAGGWQAADDKIKQSIEDAKACQQPDGGFSTEFFKRAASSPDLALRINTSGHMFEFLTVALTDEQLRQPWMTRALEFLLDAFEATEGDDLECGGLYHGAHGLVLYRERRFGQASIGNSTRRPSNL
ncbi:MAG TPA: hypothetical protein VMV69_25510 [Pirellulales bacterium]|nr:hypothetical protein [Pirellulales bacterium]